ncbi:hypothetical protein HDA40_007406 [Hamadaea flava]|uniref:Lipoprotein n=1 Tax=Hamadaea flava TaxID=1742688 RepID=A0ABV8M1K0_9ACTN|nr:hypothetical protein [Hamadaea flava]MCP2328899.1 hypothetical protein [Hamadaea flava]
MRRGWMSISMAVLTLTGLTGCSPAVDGVGGVRLDGTGRLVAVLSWCAAFGVPRTIILYPAESGGGVGDPLLRLERTGDAPDGDFLEVTLAEPGSQWKSEGTIPAALTDGSDDGGYEVRAWDESGEHRVRSFPFTLAEVRAADPARPILTKTYQGDDRYASSLLSTEEFQDTAGQECD